MRSAGPACPARPLVHPLAGAVLRCGGPGHQVLEYKTEELGARSRFLSPDSTPTVAYCRSQQFGLGAFTSS